MKKLIAILILVSFAFVASAQGVTKTQITFPKGNTYGAYVGGAMDTLTANQDSIMFPVFINNDHLTKVTVGATFLRVGASDTIVKMAIWGKNFADESYTYLTSVNTSAVTSTTVLVQKTLAYGTAIQYRYLRIHFMRPVPVTGAGTKIKLVKAEIKVYEQ